MSRSKPDVSALLSQLKSIEQHAPQDAASRQELYEAAKNLTLSFESPGDTIQRIMYLPVQTTVARIAINLNLFQILSDSDGPLGTTDLARKTSADEVLLGRLLRCLASYDMIKENGEDVWSATPITKTLTITGLVAGIHHNFDSHMPGWQALPGFLAQTKYRNPSDNAHCAFQIGHNTDLLPFIWVLNHPDRFAAFNLWMSAGREGKQIFLDVYPFEKDLCHDLTPETPLFVDVGGGIGQQCVALKQRFPNAPGRVILQEMPQTLEQAIKAEGVELMAYDFWTPQPIKGARAYYMRNIMHDYPDEKCIQILHNTMAAMDSNSVILIDDMVIPNKGAHWRTTSLDITMMSGLAAMERSERQWYQLLDSAGLKVTKIYKYTEDLGDSVIVAVPK